MAKWLIVYVAKQSGQSDGDDEILILCFIAKGMVLYQDFNVSLRKVAYSQ
jgi:hypothetical protein